MSDDRKIQKRASWWLTAGFTIILTYFTVSSLSSFDGQALVTAFPDFGSGDIGDFQNYFRSVEISFDAGFGGRELLVEANMAVKSKLFRDDLGTTVLAGKDGWLYYTGDNMVDNYLGLMTFTQAQLKSWQGELERRRAWLAARGIDYLLVVAPNKESVYPEHLPGWMKKGSTRADQFIDFMRTNSTVKILDLRPVEREAARHEPVYFATDTHWNLNGAFTASEAIAAAVAQDIPGFKPLNREDFKIERQSGPGMDLARMVKTSGWKEENLYKYEPVSRLPRLEYHGEGTNRVNYEQFGLVPVVQIHGMTTLNQQRQGRVIIFGDSFAVALQPFLGQLFGQVDFQWSEDFDAKLLLPDKLEKPVLVISEIVERRLSSASKSKPLGAGDERSVR